MSVAIQPAGSPASREHYFDTVENPVKISQYEKLLGEDFASLQKVSKNGTTALWGVTPGTNNANVNKYKKLTVGDIVIFTRDKTAFASAQITYLFRNKILAENLWGQDNKNQTWEYMYALSNVKNLQISYNQLQNAIGSKVGDNFMGFRVLNELKSQGAEKLIGITVPKKHLEIVKYWWVNQGQTYDFEVEGDFLWSPKKSKDGSRNQYYENMTLLKTGDIVFSYNDKNIRAIGTVQEKAVTTAKPDFRNAGSNWSETGWYVEVSFNKLANPFEPKKYLKEIKPLLPDKYSPLDKNGDGTQAYLFGISSELGKLLLDFSKLPKEVFVQNRIVIDESLDDQHENEILQKTSLKPREKEQLVKSRRGQGIFKSNVKHFEKSCRVTGITNKKHLIASHIKPWRFSDDTEKIDGENGLMLSYHIDHLFDKGFITFLENGKIMLSPILDLNVVSAWGINTEINVGKFTKKQTEYLKFHRENIFKSS